MSSLFYLIISRRGWIVNCDCVFLTDNDIQNVNCYFYFPRHLKSGVACGIISVEIYGGNMKKTYIYATPLWMYLTELPIIFVLTLAIIHNPSAVGMAKLYPLISLCGLALIFINLYLFRMVRISMAEVRDIGRFSPRDNGSLAAGSSIRIIPTRHGRVKIQVYGEAGLPELDWMRDQTTDPGVICMYRGRAEGGSRAIKKAMRYFHIPDTDIDEMLATEGFHREYGECTVDTLTDFEGRKEYRITLNKTVGELSVGVKSGTLCDNISVRIIIVVNYRNCFI